MYWNVHLYLSLTMISKTLRLGALNTFVALGWIRNTLHYSKIHGISMALQYST